VKSAGEARLRFVAPRRWQKEQFAACSGGVALGVEGESNNIIGRNT
jgi:hypothetical protein